MSTTREQRDAGARRPHRSWASPVAVLAAVPFAGLLLVTLASFVPDAWILDSLLEAIDRGHLTRDQFGPGTTGRTMDYFTDCIGATVGLGDGPGASAWTNAVRSPTLGSCATAVERLETYRAGGGLTSSYEYFRYWHGYAAVTRPLIALVGLAATRMIVLWMLVGAIVGLARQLTRAHDWRVATALLLPVLLTTDLIDLPRSLPHACGALVALSTAWLVHLHISSVTADLAAPSLVAISMLAGATFLFFDILTISPGAWALFVGVVMLAASQRRERSALMSTGALAAGGWIVGWAWMWFSKWLIATVVFGFDAVRDQVSNAVGQRLDGDVTWLDLTFTNSIRRTFSTWFDHPLTPAVLVLLAVLVGLAWVRSSPMFASRVGDRCMLMLPALIPPAWFEVMRNHSQVHAGFTYRSWAVVVGIVAAAAVVVLPELVSRSDPQTEQP